MMTNAMLGRTLKFLFGVLALPLFAVAQTTTSETLTITGSETANGAAPVINQYQCTGQGPDVDVALEVENLTFHWTATSAGSVSIKVSNTKDCPPTNSNSNIYTGTLVDPFDGVSGSDQWPRASDTLTKVPAKDVLASLSGQGDLTCSNKQLTSLHVCLVPSSGDPIATGPIAFALISPAKPTIDSVGSGDGALHVNWTAPGGSPAATHYMVRATPPAGSGGKTVSASDITGNSYRLSGLTNGVTYDLVVYAFDKNKNRSDPSASLQGTPQPADDFWDRYKSGGGVEEGGCSSGAAGALAPWLLPLVLWRRRRV